MGKGYRAILAGGGRTLFFVGVVAYLIFSVGLVVSLWRSGWPRRRLSISVSVVCLLIGLSLLLAPALWAVYENLVVGLLVLAVVAWYVWRQPADNIGWVTTEQTGKRPVSRALIQRELRALSGPNCIALLVGAIAAIALVYGGIKFSMDGELLVRAIWDLMKRQF